MGTVRGHMEQTAQIEAADFVVATYDEIRVRFSLGGTDHARMRAKRRKWPAEPKNDPGGLTSVRVPREEWDAAIPSARSSGTGVPVPREHDHSNKLKVLDAALIAFKEEQERGTVREERLRVELAAAVATLGEQRSRADRAEGELEGIKLATEHQHAELAQMRSEVAEAHNRAVTAERQAINATRQREGAEMALARARKWNFLNFLFGREGKGRQLRD